MKFPLCSPVLTSLATLFGVVTLIGTTASVSQASYVRRNQFFCGRSNGLPATLIRTSRGEIPMIRWVSDAFVGFQYTQQRRCEEVSTRLQRFNDRGLLKFIRTGTVHRHPVLCVTNRKGGACSADNVLITLQQGANPQIVLQQLLDLRARAAGRVLHLSGSQLISYEDREAYLNLEELLELNSVEPVSPFLDSNNPK